MPFPDEPELLPAETMKKHNVPTMFQDSCAHLLIALNDCRIKSKYVPWECGHENHAHEKCEYKGYIRRLARKAQETSQ